jgi:hypothetical protein
LLSKHFHELAKEFYQQAGKMMDRRYHFREERYMQLHRGWSLSFGAIGNPNAPSGP